MSQAYVTSYRSENFQPNSSGSRNDLRLHVVNAWENYPGLGLHLSKTQSKNGIVVSKVEQGSPASACGMMVGDRIIEINDIYVEDMPFMDILEILRKELRSKSVKFLVTSSPQPIGPHFDRSSVITQQTPPYSKFGMSGASSDTMTIGSLVSKGTGEPVDDVIRDLNKYSEKLKPFQLTEDKITSPDELDKELRETLRSMRNRYESDWYKDDSDIERIMVTSKKRSYRSHPVILERNDVHDEWGMSVAPDADVGHIVSDVVSGSAADRGNIRIGNVIIQISDDVVLHLPYKKLVSRLQSLTNKRVFLSVAPKDVIMRCALEHIPILTQYDTTRTAVRQQPGFASLPQETRESMRPDKIHGGYVDERIEKRPPPLMKPEFETAPQVRQSYQVPPTATAVRPVMQQPSYVHGELPSPKPTHGTYGFQQPEPPVSTMRPAPQSQPVEAPKIPTSVRPQLTKPVVPPPAVQPTPFIPEKPVGQYPERGDISPVPPVDHPPLIDLAPEQKPIQVAPSKVSYDVQTPTQHLEPTPVAYPNGVRSVIIQKSKSTPVGFQLKTLEQDDGQSHIHVFGGIVKGMSADRAGVKEYDRLISVDGVSVNDKTHAQVLEMLKRHVPQLNLTVTEDDDIRAALGGSTTAPTQEREEPADLSDAADKDIHTFTMKVDPTSGSIGLRLTKDMVVQSVEPNGPAAQAGIQRGDMVINVNNEDVSSSDHQHAFYNLRHAIASGSVVLKIKRTPGTASPSISRSTAIPTAPSGDTRVEPTEGAVLSSVSQQEEKASVGSRPTAQPEIIRPSRQPESPPGYTQPQIGPTGTYSGPSAASTGTKTDYPPATTEPTKPAQEAVRAGPPSSRSPERPTGLTRTCTLTGLVQGSPLGLSLKDNKNKPAEITKITPASPADRAGLKVRDYVLRINDVDAEKAKFSDIKSMITASISTGRLQLVVISDDLYDQYRGD